MNGLGLVIGGKRRDGLELIDYPLHNKVQPIRFRKTPVRYRHGHLGVKVGNALCAYSGCDIVFVDPLITKPAEMILRSEAAGHDDPINGGKVGIGYWLEQEWAVDGHRQSLAWQRNGGK